MQMISIMILDADAERMGIGVSTIYTRQCKSINTPVKYYSLVTKDAKVVLMDKDRVYTVKGQIQGDRILALEVYLSTRLEIAREEEKEEIDLNKVDSKALIAEICKRAETKEKDTIDGVSKLSMDVDDFTIQIFGPSDLVEPL